MGHDVTVFHVLAGEERQWTWAGDVEAVDSETGARVVVSPAAAQAYRTRMDAFVERWRGRCLSDGMLYVSASVEAPPADVLRGYLLRRSGGVLR